MTKKFAATTFSSWIFNWYRNTIRHPKWGWLIVLGSLLYLLNPLDILPDVIPVVGWIDDGLIATVLVSEVAQIMSDRLKAQKNKPTAEAQPTPEQSSVIDVASVSLR